MNNPEDKIREAIRILESIKPVHSEIMKDHYTHDMRMTADQLHIIVDRYVMLLESEFDDQYEGMEVIG